VFVRLTGLQAEAAENGSAQTGKTS